MVTISGSLDNNVLFLAIGPGANADYIIKSPALPTMDNIGGFQCLNAHGSAGDGMNNGGKLGSIQMQVLIKCLLLIYPTVTELEGLANVFVLVRCICISMVCLTTLSIGNSFGDDVAVFQNQMRYDAAFVVTNMNKILTTYELFIRICDGWPQR